MIIPYNWHCGFLFFNLPKLIIDILSKPSPLVIGEADSFGTHVGEHLMKYGRVVATLDDLSGGLGENINEFLYSSRDLWRMKK